MSIENNKNIIAFNKNWKFCRGNYLLEQLETDSINWEKVILPHTWNDKDMVPGASNPYIGVAWYKKSFETPLLYKDKRILIEFEAIAIASEVWVDQVYVGGRNGGFLGFSLDITDALDDEKKEHEIMVRVDNSYNTNYPPPIFIDWERYGGIYRPAWMYCKNSVHIAYKGVKIDTPEVLKEKAKVRVETQIVEKKDKGNYILKHTLYNSKDNIESQKQENISTSYFHTAKYTIDLPEINNPQLWSIENPVLYKLKTEILCNGKIIDTVYNNFGIRYFHFDKNKGFFLNGKNIKLKGCNIHQDYPGLGPACPERFHYEDIKLMKEMGCNYLRASHYPRNERCLDACDKLGILVMEEQPFWHGSIRTYQGEQFYHNSKRMVKEMVEQHYNHPSIILWNTVNEVMLVPKTSREKGHAEAGDDRRKEWVFAESENEYTKRVVAGMYDSIKKLDTERPITGVIGGKWKLNEKVGITKIPDIIGYNGGFFNFKNPVYKDKTTGKNYRFLPDYFRDKYPELIPIMTEGILNDSRCIYKRADWEKEYEAWKIQAEYWNEIYKREWFSGGSMWVFTDYHANNQLRTMGAMDVSRLPKEMYYFYKAMWLNKPVIHILGHWEKEKIKQNQDVVVFTNCENVELFLNECSLDQGISTENEWPHIPNPPLIWKDVSYEPGCLKAKGRFGNRIFTDKRITSGTPHTFKIKARPDIINADGRDISYITVEIIDNEGNRCYNTFPELELNVSGNASLMGFKKQVARGGLLKFTVRSNGTKGKSIISVNGASLIKAVCELQCE